MNISNKSIFNLIEIFRSTPKQAQPLVATEHCGQKFHHDFYCDAEKPFIQKY
ncbi:MAG: hypothetical protein ABGX00_08220 [Allomuricauda sp.]|jgi:hypothetical protein|uniref:hypothetical protein n=1 Tax=Flagellimonas beolgyonensis TaxID=864064 RepID=UPI0013DFA44F|nr:hypothetical protein [Allomuricauda beolgyonensis]